MYKAYVTQAGEGCDHTIGCGLAVWNLKATSYQEAVDELKERVIGEWDKKDNRFYDGYWGEWKLDTVILFEVAAEFHPPVWKWYQTAEKQEKNGKAVNAEVAEKAQYDRLKEKFEPKE